MQEKKKRFSRQKSNSYLRTEGRRKLRPRLNFKNQRKVEVLYPVKGVIFLLPLYVIKLPYICILQIYHSRCYILGYRTIAINQVVDVDANASTETKKKKKKGESRDVVECVPPPKDLTEVNEKIKALGFENVSILNRLTIIFSSQDTLQKYVKSINYKKYDILGVIPTTVQALAFVCGTLEADILSFDPQNKFGLKLNRK